jgi:ABC-2 type transport system permease protein
LLIILLSFSTFAGEREQGTLRQLLSLGVKKTDLAWGKALGVAGALGALIIPATVIGVIALALTSENGSLAAGAPRMALMFASYMLYFIAFIGASLGVSARAKSSQMASPFNKPSIAKCKAAPTGMTPPINVRKR